MSFAVPSTPVEYSKNMFPICLDNAQCVRVYLLNPFAAYCSVAVAVGTKGRNRIECMHLVLILVR